MIEKLDINSGSLFCNPLKSRLKMDNEILINEPEVNLYETGVTPEDVLKKSHNGMAPLEKLMVLYPGRKIREIYDPAELKALRSPLLLLFFRLVDRLKLNVEQTPDLLICLNFVGRASKTLKLLG